MENETTTGSEAQGGATPADAAPKAPVKKKPAVRKRPAKKAAVKAPKKPAAKLVVFFRHGIAEDPSEEKADGDRSLTTSGHDRTKRSARGLAKVIGDVDVILSSPLLRALQTALWVTKAYGGKVKVHTTDVLLPDAGPEDVLKAIGEVEGKNIVVVGHEPNLSACAASLLGVPGLRMNVRRAGCVAIRIDEEGKGTLEWLLAPRTLRGLRS